MLQVVKLALKVVTDDYDDEITRLINSAIADIGITGTDAEALQDDPLVEQAIVTYCILNFRASSSDYDRLERSYNNQKAQLQTATGYGL